MPDGRLPATTTDPGANPGGAVPGASTGGQAGGALPGVRVAALGNVTTHPRLRGRGLATAALRLYGRLGFTRVADYGEYALGAHER